MEDFNNLVEVQPVDLRDLVETRELKSLPVHDTALKNRAAIASLLSEDTSKVMEKYQAVLTEAKSGETYTHDKLLSDAVIAEQPSDMKGIMTILADPSIPLEQKKIAIAGINSKFAKDSSTLITTRAYSQPSGKEDVEQENVRISGAEQFANIRKQNEAIEAIKTQHALSLDPDVGNAVVDFISLITPFSTNKYGATTLAQAAKAIGVNISTGKATVLPGEAVVAIRDALANMPIEKQVQATEAITNIIKNNSSLFFNSDNNFAEYQQMQAIFEQGGYGNVSRFLDNVSGILDLAGLGFLGKGTKVLTKLFTRTPEVSASKTLVRSTTDTISNVSPLKIMQDANPDKARKMLSVIVNENSDEAAQALAGTTRIDAVAGQVVPQPLVVDGSVTPKLIDPLREFKTIEPDVDVYKAYSDVGGLWFTEKEKLEAGAKIYKDFTNVDGITLHDNLVSVGTVGDKAIIKAVYGNSEGGFLSAESALNQAKFSLREYGVVDQDLNLLKRIEGEYVPITLAEAKGVDGDYLVSIEKELKFSQKDVTVFDPQDVKRNWFDRIPIFRSNKAGTLANHLLDNASMLSPVYTGAGVVATDKATRIDKMLLNLHSNFSDDFIRIPKARQDFIYEHIKEANLLGLELSDNALLAKGFAKDEITVLKNWRKSWDTHFFFENHDAGRTLANKKYMVLESGTGDKFFARPISKESNIVNAYDPSLNQVVALQKSDIDDLYTKGGTFAELVRPSTINRVPTEHIIVRNTPSEYLRRITDSDQVLNYRKGYYQVHYKAPKFIEELAKDSAGRVYNKTIAMAGSTKEAEQVVDRLRQTSGKPIADYNIRDDIKNLRVDTDAYWDLMTSSGRVAQRHRGARLEAISSPNVMFDSKYIADPVESAIRASRSLSGRIATRDFLETSKARVMSQYGEFFPNGRWVENSNSLISRKSLTGADIADARTSVEYINFLQHGYDNSVDDGFKSVMNAFANMSVKAGIETGEKMFLHLAQGAPTNFLKNGVFQSYLALNPFRQLIVQSHQSIRLAAYNPTYVLRGGVALDGSEYLMMKSGMIPVSKNKALFDFIEDSGMLDAVDKQNLVRGSLSDLAESYNPVSRNIGKVLSVPRKFGFDLGEQANLLSHLLAVRDKFQKAGRNIADPAVRDEAYSVARALSYDMNFAGDMPYNQNTLGLFMQFFQVPHKAITSVMTNRRIAGGDQLRMAAADLVLFGVPGATILYNMLPKGVLPEDPEVREATVFGMETILLNKSLSLIAGQKINVDFSALSPYGVDGFANLFHAIVSGGTMEFIQNTPAFTLYLKEGSRMREALGRSMRYLGFIDTEQGLPPETGVSVLSGLAEMSSGWSNYLKAKAIVETGKLPTTHKNERMQDTKAFTYAAAKLFGFGSLQETMFYAATKEITAGTKAHEAEVQSWYKSYSKVLTRDQKFTSENPEYTNTVLGAAKLMWKDDYKAMEIINKLLAKDLADKENSLMKRILEYGNIKGADEHASTLKMLPSLKDEDYNKALKLFDDAQAQANKGQE